MKTMFHLTAKQWLSKFNHTHFKLHDLIHLKLRYFMVHIICNHRSLKNIDTQYHLQNCRQINKYKTSTGIIACYQQSIIPKISDIPDGVQYRHYELSSYNFILRNKDRDYISCDEAHIEYMSTK